MSAFSWVNDIFGGETAVAPPPPDAGYPKNQQQSSSGGYGFFSPWSASTPVTAPAAEPIAARPTQTEANLVAKAVRTRGEKKLVTSWENLMGEFDVQNRIWDSLSTAASGDQNSEAARAAAAAAGPEGKRAQMKAAMTQALDASQSDPKGAVSLLKPLISVSTPGQEAPAKILNHSTEKAAHLVIKALRLTQLCDRLAQSLEAFGGGTSEKEKEQLLAACQLQEGPLESRCRRVLDLGPSKSEKEKAAKKAKESEHAALQAAIQQIASAANVSPEKAASALENARGDADKALYMLLSEEEERQARKAAALAEKMEKKMEQEQKKMEQKQKLYEAKIKEASSLASVVSKLAANTITGAWAKVQAEFEVQMNVWDSVAAANGNGAAQYQVIQMEMQGVLDSATQDPANAVMLLEYLLQKITTETRLALSNGMMLAADGVLDAERVSAYRRQLAARLRDLSRAEESEYSGAIESELKSVVQSCNLDQVLKSRVLDLVKPRSIVKSV
eukprot:gb/GFBE01046581.1/.p1 GENE.gb/GFBE01046581.1/~~gb/GFBE01046581.1/.p1  ORF type:complete len:503 (+),score=146.42 gb/GFBE01046581.1/:1-1509(+)